MSIAQENRIQALEIVQQTMRQEIADLKMTVTTLTSLVENELKSRAQAAVERTERTGKQDGIRAGQRGKAKA